MFKAKFKLLAGVGAARPFYAVKNEAVPTVYVYDQIDAWYGVSAKQFVQDLNAIDSSEIHVRINSVGGDVFEAKAIATALRNHKAKVVTFVDGLAASAATTVAIAGDEVHMAPTAQFMIHNAWSYAAGDYRDMAKMSDTLKRVNDGIVAEYSDKTGLSVSQIEQMMNDETWLSGAEALQKGFVDVLDEKASKASNFWDLSGFKNAPAELMVVDQAEQFDVEHLRRYVRMLEVCD
jgi:ATP-dependent Clp protease protease subunit